MAVEMIVILSFQSMYGFLYQWIGILVAVFMAGLSVGAWGGTRLLAGMHNGYRAFFLAESVLACLLFLAAWGLAPGHAVWTLEAGFTRLPLAVLLGVNLLAGALAGIEFPLAAGEAARGGRQAAVSAAGRLYALDLAGAWLGTFLVSVWWVPLLGFRSTLLLAGILKATALGALALAALGGASCRR